MRDLGGFAYPTGPDANGIVRLPDVDKRKIQAFASMEWVATDPADVVERLRRAVKCVSPDLPASGGRAMPLIGVPLAVGRGTVVLGPPR